MKGLNYCNYNANEIEFKNKYLKVPVDLCIYAFTNKLLKPFRLYILLSAATRGNIILTEKDEHAISSQLGYATDKSVKNNLAKLQVIAWIGYDVKSKKYWIRGFDEIRKRLKLKRKKAVLFNRIHLADFNAFCFSTIIGYLNLCQRWRRRLAQMRGEALPDLLSHSDYLPVANRYLAKVLKISLSSTSRYKRYAKDAGFIEIIPSSSTVRIKPHELGSFKSNDSELYGKMYVAGKNVVEPGPDLVKVHLYFSARKRLDT